MKILNNQEDHFLCYYSLVLDSYSKFCDIGCVYCYATEFDDTKRVKMEVSELGELFELAFNQNDRSPLAVILRKKIPIRLGFETDPLQVIEKKFRVTESILKLFRKFNYPYIIFTKSELILEPRYLNLLDKDLSYVQVSISSVDEGTALINEKRAPLPANRLNIVETLQNRGISAAVRFNLLPQHMRKDNKETYLSLVQDFLLKSSVKKVILNEIHIRQAGGDNFLNLSENEFHSLKKKFSTHSKNLTYCYLGGSSSRFFSHENTNCKNCCQCDLGKNTTRQNINLIETIRLKRLKDRPLEVINFLLLKIFDFFYSNIFK